MNDDGAHQPKPIGWKLINTVMTMSINKAHDYRAKAAKCDLVPVV